jgi:hypothetical protein
VVQQAVPGFAPTRVYSAFTYSGHAEGTMVYLGRAKLTVELGQHCPPTRKPA